MTPTRTLTPEQIAALETAGEEIAAGWIAQDPEPDPDYDLSADGDWRHVRAAAQAVGIDWQDMQPETGADEIWSAALGGYRRRLEEERTEFDPDAVIAEEGMDYSAVGPVDCLVVNDAGQLTDDNASEPADLSSEAAFRAQVRAWRAATQE